MNPDLNHIAYLPIRPGTSAEILAQQTIGAMVQDRLDEAVSSASIMHHNYPNLPESYVLYAKALSKAGRFSQSMAVWEEAVNYLPLKTIWLAQAIQVAVKVGNEEVIKRFLSLLEGIFIHPPSAGILAELTRQGRIVSGSVGIHCNQVMGWTWLPVGMGPRIEPIGGGASSPTILHTSMQICGTHALRSFALALPESKDAYSLRVFSPDHKDIPGSPLTCEPVSSISVRKTNRTGRPVVLMPVYDDKRATWISLASLLASQRVCTTPFDIVVVWDHGPDRHLFQYLERLARFQKIKLEVTPRNLGFLGAVNHGLRQYPNRDIVLLNADTIVNGDWFDRLHRISRACPKVGTITPMGSFAELVSFPSPRDPADVTSRKTTAKIDQAFKDAAGRRPWLEIPVGVGFCMYVTRELLNRIGGLDGYWLFSGYGEEVDLCLRAKKAGFCNLVALNVFVAHFGNRSFGLRKKALVAQNNKALFSRYPEYDKQYRQFLQDDPLRPHREAVSLKLYRPLDGPLHILYAWDKDSPNIDLLREAGKLQNQAWGALLIQDLGTKTYVTLQVRREIKLADTRFILPLQWPSLKTAMERLSPTCLMLNSLAAPVLKLAQQLGYPMELCLGQLTPQLLRLWRNGSPCPEDAFNMIRRVHCLDKDVAGWISAAGINAEVVLRENHIPVSEYFCAEIPAFPAWLVPAPRHLEEFRRLCSQASQQSRYGTLFYVLGVDDLWGNTPRPANIRPCPPVDREKSTPARAMLIIGNDPEQIRMWSAWAADRKIPCYLSVA
ncbi:MAG: glycosyltransferase [Desulfatirhabdiaceae bacterium]